jgi:hypothetical protein
MWSIEDAGSVFNKMPSQDVVTWDGHIWGMCHAWAWQGSSNILNGCVKKVYSQMISLLFVFCQLVSACTHAGLVDEGITVILQWPWTI